MPDIKTQAALDKVLKKDPGDVIRLVGKVAFVISLSGHTFSPSIVVTEGARLRIDRAEGPRLYVVARENSSVVARENSSVVARENSSVVAWGNSSVEAWGNSSVEARGNSSVVARENSSVVARENSSVVAWGNSSVVARENSSVVAWGNSSVVAWENSSVEAWEFSSVVARENSSVEARGNSSVVAWENSSVVARENSSVVARENSSVVARENSSVVARGYVFVRHYSAKKVEAAATCIVALHGRAATSGGAPEVGGGQQIACPAPETAEAWCSFYGLPVNDGTVILYKGVDKNYRSGHGGDYTPGTTPRLAEFHPEPECAAGALYFSPSPLHTRHFISAEHYLGCPVKVSEIVVHPYGSYPEKVKAIGCCGPVFEVDQRGKALPAPTAAS